MKYKELDKYFNNVVEPNKEIFNKLSTSEELHYIAENHNWDNGITVLEWIVESILCSEATALMIFWRAQPYDYIKYDLNKKETKYVDMDIFNLIKKILEKYPKKLFKKTEIKYDPKEDMPKIENIPEIMYQETNGEEPYLYYDEKESISLFGEYLENILARCNDSMELYNIAYLLKSMEFLEVYEKLLDNKHCDKGVALFIYWKAKRYFPYVDMQKVVEKIVNNEYKEIIKYNPKEDKTNKMNINNKWEIPEIMKMEIK